MTTPSDTSITAGRADNADTPNASQAAHWNGEESSHWVTHADRYDAMLGPLGALLLAGADLQAGQRVLDVGCGNGAVTLDAGRAVGSTGRVLGADLSNPMSALATRRAEAAGLPQVTFTVADAQTQPFAAGSFDRIISRFGVMFFDDPVAAFTNLRRSLSSQGSITFLCWQDLFVNDWMIVPGAAAATVLGMPNAEPNGEGGPGPFSLANTDLINALLIDAGFSTVQLTSAEALLPIGSGATADAAADQAADFLLGTGLGKAMFDGASEEDTAKALEAVRESITPHYADGAIRLTGRAWLVRAS